ncbi:hypothetical protein SAMN05428997_13157 [Bosea sp. CRIB-10]|nr:hypothetical protein SAMN05428997_13157 [Bosea sp. CRIB-10]
MSALSTLKRLALGCFGSASLTDPTESGTKSHSGSGDDSKGNRPGMPQSGSAYCGCPACAHSIGATGTMSREALGLRPW